MLNKEIGLVLQLIAHNAQDQWFAINSKVASSKGYRPVWKITEIGEGEAKQLLVDEFQPLLAHCKMLENLAKNFLGQNENVTPLPEDIET